MSNSPIGVRLANAEDVRFISGAWFNSGLKSGVKVDELAFSIYRDGMDATIVRLLAQSNTRVAFAKSCPDVVLGYAVIEDALKCCHHIYVKSAYRRQGIARGLLEDVRTYSTPATPGAGRRFATAMQLQYNPILADPLEAR